MRGEWGGKPYKRQFGYHDTQHRQKIDCEIRQVVMRVVRAQQKQHDRHAQQELLGGCVLIPVVDLLPHVQIVVGAGVEFKGHSPHPVEHQV